MLKGCHFWPAGASLQTLQSTGLLTCHAKGPLEAATLRSASYERVSSRLPWAKCGLTRSSAASSAGSTEQLHDCSTCFTAAAAACAWSPPALTACTS